MRDEKHKATNYGDFPQHVSLGTKNTWIAAWSGGRISWNLGTQYDRLSEHLSTHASEKDGVMAV